MSPFRIVDADYAADLERLRAVREPVFVLEQQVPIELEWDDLDPLSRHVLALDDQGRAIATGRLTPERKIGRMAVLADWRGRGVGAAVLERLIAIARVEGLPAVELHAQESAIGFYQRYGFLAHGEPFDEAGIRHRHMRLVL
ncbi:MAG: GNAT family N-acetyltransferase [Xanthomonadales bacterium]|nr:GNAT family N-acetyltransferase [Xanthomonadales bacterium]